MSLKIRKSSVSTILIVLLVFQGILSSRLFSAIGYIDELITAIGIIVLFAVYRKKDYKEMRNTIVLFIFLLALGIASTLLSDIKVNTVSRILDAFSFSKFIVIFWLGIVLGEHGYSRISAWKSLSSFIRFFILIAFLFCIINIFFDIGMHTDYRYGLRCFEFIYDRVGGLYSSCVIFLAIQTIDIYYNGSSQVKRLFLIITAFVMCSTLRSRAFAFTAMYFAGYLLFVLNKKYRFKLWHIIIILLVGGIIAYPQIRFYLIDNETQARARLFKYGFETARAYFPLGSGFSTYGSFQAKQVSSPLYTRYGFNRFYGLGLVKSTYLTDDFWPAVVAEFGFFGVFFIVLILIQLTKYITKKIKTQKVIFFAVVFLWVSVFASSIATASYINATAEMLIIGVVIGEFTRETLQSTQPFTYI